MLRRPRWSSIRNYGINWLLAALGAAVFLGGLSTLFDNDDVEVSPA